MTSPNAQQIEYWNTSGGSRWVAGRNALDRGLAAIGDALFAFAAPKPGERVLDIGCGCGTTTRELYRRTRTAVLGVDISEPMLEVARADLAAGEPVTFERADASERVFDPVYDLVFSRFGVMFFADPVDAFANLRTATAPEGRLAFACWRPLDVNPWAGAPLDAARPLLPPQTAMDPHAPGPFAFADAERLRGILEAAGWRSIEIRALDSKMWMGDTLEEAVSQSVSIGPLARILTELGGPTQEIRDRVAQALAPYVTPTEVAPPALAWLVGAR